MTRATAAAQPGCRHQPRDLLRRQRAGSLTPCGPGARGLGRLDVRGRARDAGPREQDGGPGRVAREDGHRQAARPWGTAPRSAAAMVAASSAVAFGSTLPSTTTRGTPVDSPATVGCLEAHRAVGAQPADVRAQVLPERRQHPAATQQRALAAAADRHDVAAGYLEAQVRIAGRDAVQLAVPGAGLVGDVLERRDRQVAVRPPGSPP